MLNVTSNKKRGQVSLEPEPTSGDTVSGSIKLPQSLVNAADTLGERLQAGMRMARPKPTESW